MGGGGDPRRPASLWLLLSLAARRAAGAARLPSRSAWSIVARGGRAARVRRWCSSASGSASPAPTSARRWRSLARRARARRRAAPRRLGPGGRAPARVRTLRELVGDGWVPIVGLFLLAVLQNVDVILVKRQLGGDAAGAYAAAAVAAKAVVWVAIGIGLYLLPEATRRAAAGLDPRPVLLRALGGRSALVAVPMLLDLRAGPDAAAAARVRPGRPCAADALFVLGVAMTLLAVAYLSVQYMLALGETRSCGSLGVVAIAETFAARRGRRRRSSDVRRDRARRAVRGRARRSWRSGCRARRRRRAAAARERRRRVGGRRGVEGWLTEAQARRLSRAARRVRGRRARSSRSARSAGARRSCSRCGAPASRSWRSTRTPAATAGRRRSRADAARGDEDHEAFAANLARAGVARPRAPRAQLSAEALGDVDGPVDAAVRRRRAPLRPGARRPRRLGRARRARRAMLVHDAFSSVGVTLALLRDVLVLARVALRRARRVAGRVRARRRRRRRARNALRQLRELPWFARNVVIKALILARLRRGPWPYWWIHALRCWRPCSPAR